MAHSTISSTITSLINGMEVNSSNIGKSASNGTAETLNFYKTLEMGSNTISTGIKHNRLLNVIKQGSPEHVDNDLAMMVGDGGFFIVTETTDPNDNAYLYTRSGYFFFDKDGYAKNTEGLYLRVAKFSNTTKDYTNYIKNNIDVGDLVPLNRNDLVSSLKETGNIGLNFSLPLPKPNDIAEKREFTRQFRVFDKIGQEHSIDLKFLRDEENTRKWKIFFSSDENLEIYDNNNNMVHITDEKKLAEEGMDKSAPFEIEFNTKGELIKISKLNQIAVTKNVEITDQKGNIFYKTDQGFFTIENIPAGVSFLQATDDQGNVLWLGADGKGYVDEASAKNAGTTLKYELNADGTIKEVQTTNADGALLWKGSDGNLYAETDALPTGVTFEQAKDLGGNPLYITTDGLQLTLAEIKAQGRLAEASKNINGEPLYLGTDGNEYTETEALDAGVDISLKNQNGESLFIADDGKVYSTNTLPAGVNFVQATNAAGELIYVDATGTKHAYANADAARADADAGNVDIYLKDADGNQLFESANGESFKSLNDAIVAGDTLVQNTNAAGELIYLDSTGTMHAYTDENTARADADAGNVDIYLKDADDNQLFESANGGIYKDSTDAAATGDTLLQLERGGESVFEGSDGNQYTQTELIAAQAADPTLDFATDPTTGNKIPVYKKALNKSFKRTLHKSLQVALNPAPLKAKVPNMQKIQIPMKIAKTEEINTFDWEEKIITDATDPEKIVIGETQLNFMWHDGGTTTTNLDFGKPLDTNTASGLSTKFDSFNGEITQDGNAVGQFQSLSTSVTGEVTVIYDNGLTSPYAKIPVGQFNNPNALQAVSGNAYKQTHESGPLRMTDGKVLTGVIEKSSVDQIRNIIEANNTQKTIGFSVKAYAKQNEVEDMILKTL